MATKRSKFGKYLDDNGIKQVWVAEKSNLGQDIVNKLATGRLNPVYAEKEIIAEVLCCKVDDVFDTLKVK